MLEIKVITRQMTTFDFTHGIMNFLFILSAGCAQQDILPRAYCS